MNEKLGENAVNALARDIAIRYNKKYGDTLALYDNWMFSEYMPGTIYEKGLRRRRRAEWRMFHCGEYVMDGEVSETC